MNLSDEKKELRKARPIRYFIYRNIVSIAKILLGLASYVLFKGLK